MSLNLNKTRRFKLRLIHTLASLLLLAFGLSSCFGQSFQPKRVDPSLAELENAQETTAPSETHKGLAKVTTPSGKIEASEKADNGKSQQDTEKEDKKKGKKDKQDKKDKESKESLDYSKESSVNLTQYVYNGDATHYAFAENTEATADLEAAIKNFLADRGLSGANISIVYDDLVNQTRYCYRPDVRYTAASVIKVPMAMVIAQLVDEGVFAPDMQIVYEPGKDFTADNLDASRVGQMVGMQEMINSALLYSDNSATSVVFEYFRRQGSYLHQYMDARTGTNYSNDVTISAREGIGLIEQLYLNQSSYPSYQGILNTMSGTSWQQFLTAGIPVSVSSKYGNLGALNHEIGLVWGDHPFAYSVMTEGINAYSVLPELGALLYQYSQGQVASIPVKETSESSAETLFPEESMSETTEASSQATASTSEQSSSDFEEESTEESSAEESTSEQSTEARSETSIEATSTVDPNIFKEDPNANPHPSDFGGKGDVTWPGKPNEEPGPEVVFP